MRRLAILAVMAAILAVLGWTQATAQEPEHDFVWHLNQVRAARGLHAVISDSSLTQTAEQNNQYQRIRGLGHWVTGGYAQCAAICGNTESALAMWCRSSPHAALIFAPNLVAVGYHYDGWAATVSLQMDSPQATPGPYPANVHRPLGAPTTSRIVAVPGTLYGSGVQTTPTPNAVSMAASNPGRCYTPFRVSAPAGRWVGGNAQACQRRGFHLFRRLFSCH